MTGLLVHIHQKEKIAVKVASANGPLLFTSGIVLVCGKYNVYPAKHSIHIYRDVLGGGGGGGGLCMVRSFVRLDHSIVSTFASLSSLA